MSAAASTIATAIRTQNAIGVNSVLTDGLGNTASYNFNTQNDSIQDYTDGVLNNTTNLHFILAQRITLTPASGTYDIDLTAIQDWSKQLTGLGTVKLLYIKNRVAAGGGQLLMGPGPSNGWTTPWDSSGTPTTVKLAIDPLGKFHLENPSHGYSVSATKKVIRFTHNGGSSGSIVFDFIIGGF